MNQLKENLVNFSLSEEFSEIFSEIGHFTYLELLSSFVVLIWIVLFVVGLVHPETLFPRSSGKSRKHIITIFSFTFIIIFALISLLDPKFTIVTKTSVLTGIAIICVVLSLIFPWLLTPWMKSPNRKKAVPFYFIILIVTSIAYNHFETNQEVDSRFYLNENELIMADDEALIQQLVASKLKGLADYKISRVREIVVDKADGRYLISVSINTDEDYPTSSGKGAISDYMKEVYKAAYTSGHNISDTVIAAYFPRRKGRGEIEHELIWKTSMSKDEAANIDWYNEYNSLLGESYDLDLDEYTIYIHKDYI